MMGKSRQCRKRLPVLAGVALHPHHAVVTEAVEIGHRMDPDPGPNGPNGGRGGRAPDGNRAGQNGKKTKKQAEAERREKHRQDAGSEEEEMGQPETTWKKPNVSNAQVNAIGEAQFLGPDSRNPGRPAAPTDPILAGIRNLPAPGSNADGVRSQGRRYDWSEYHEAQKRHAERLAMLGKLDEKVRTMNAGRPVPDGRAKAAGAEESKGEAEEERKGEVEKEERKGGAEEESKGLYRADDVEAMTQGFGARMNIFASPTTADSSANRDDHRPGLGGPHLRLLNSAREDIGSEDPIMADPLLQPADSEIPWLHYRELQPEHIVREIAEYVKQFLDLEDKREGILPEEARVMIDHLLTHPEDDVIVGEYTESGTNASISTLLTVFFQDHFFVSDTDELSEKTKKTKPLPTLVDLKKWILARLNKEKSLKLLPSNPAIKIKNEEKEKREMKRVGGLKFATDNTTKLQEREENAEAVRQQLFQVGPSRARVWPTIAALSG